MKRSQISVEFIALFTIILFMLAVLIAFLPGWLEKTSEARNLPEKIVRDIKTRAITASLSEADFESNITLNKRVNEVTIDIEVRDDPDNMLIIRNNDTRAILAKTFLPVINSTSGSGLTVTIRKDADANTLDIELS
ncbi:hypothetical protein JXB28_06610 [Candidatus Woesearchaeota archaeon]|nr:hypothetical protein [Candidatus Woesearchaeota archaeon]